MSSSKVFKTAKKDRRVAETIIMVGGVEVHVYFRSDKCNPMDVPLKGASLQHAKFMYFLHGRQRSYEDSAAMGKKILEEYYNKDSTEGSDLAPLIIFAWDQRNHGKRTISAIRNQTWDGGNPFHAQDMISVIDASVVELKSIADYIPSFLPGYKSFSRVTKIIAGVSMSGHTVIRTIVRFPGYFQAAIPIIGCFDVTTLMLKRLQPELQHVTLYIHSYGILTPRLGDDAEKYPEQLFNITSDEDSRVARLYDTRRTKTLALFGAFDIDVPPDYSLPFLDAIGEELKESIKVHSLDKTKKFQAIAYPCAHTVTNDMLKHCSDFTKLL